MTRLTVMFSLGLWLTSALAKWSSAATGTEAPAFVLPPGYTIEKAAGEPAIQFPMFAAFDETGRLFVAESSGLDLYAELQKLSRTCRISVLEDKDGDGRFESARVFADNLVFPMGLAWHGGRLYVADPPKVMVLEDTDGDGRADRRTALLGEFGHLDNGSLHGLIFGPDGWLYMTMGQPDGYRFTRPDGAVISGKSGALIRCRPDGTDVEVISRGFENLVEVDFQPTGEIIGTDNWFYLPASGVRDALVHLLPGGLYPMYLKDQGSPMLVTGTPLPCIAVYPAVAFSGITRYRGGLFPAASRGDWFSAQHNTRQVIQHHFDREGSTFRSTDSPLVTTQDPDFHPADVLEDADGSLLIVDTGSWYIHHCPTGRIRNVVARGGIYRVRHSQGTAMADPRGLKLNWTNPSVGDLLARLNDARVAVQERASDSLVGRGKEAVPGLKTLLRRPLDFSVFEKAIWILARVPEGSDALVEATRREHPEEVALAARALGRQRQSDAADALAALLHRPEPHVRLAAAEALAQCGNPKIVPQIIDALSQDKDVFLQHGLMNALYHLASTADLVKALDHPSAQVQRAALVLLDQPPRNALKAQGAIGRLFSPDLPLREAARAALVKHVDWVDQALPALRKVAQSTQPEPADLAMMSECLLAFSSHPAVAGLGTEILAGNGSGQMRHTALKTIARMTSEQLPRAWRDQLPRLLRSPDPGLQLEAVRAARVIQSPELDQALMQLGADELQPTSARVESMAAVVRRRPKLGQAELALLFRLLGPTNAPAMRLTAADVLSQAELTGAQLKQFVQLVKNDAVMAPSLVLAATEHSPAAAENATDLVAYFRRAAESGWPISPETLQWLTGIAGNSAQAELQELRQMTNEREARQRAQLAELEPMLEGGDPNRGHELFLTKATCATCHRVGEHGGLVGPDLTRIGRIRAGRDLLESLVAPSATFAQSYEPYVVALKDGESLNGVRVRQNDDRFVLRDAGGNEIRLDPSQIETVHRSQVSIMPEGLLTALSREEIRDLLAYLQHLK